MTIKRRLTYPSDHNLLGTALPDQGSGRGPTHPGWGGQISLELELWL